MAATLLRKPIASKTGGSASAIPSVAVGILAELRPAAQHHSETVRPPELLQSVGPQGPGGFKSLRPHQIYLTHAPQPLFTARTSGKRRTSSTKFASKEEVLS